MFKEKVIPVSYEVWDTDEGCNPILKEAYFFEPFGPWKDREFCSILKILHTEGKIQELNKNGKLIKEASFKLVCIDNEEPIQEETVQPEEVVNLPEVTVVQ